MNFREHATLAQDSEFRMRLRAASMQYAMYLMGTGIPVDEQGHRHLMSASAVVMSAGLTYLDQVAWIVAGNTTILASYVANSNISLLLDTDLQYAVQQDAWPKLNQPVEDVP